MALFTDGIIANASELRRYEGSILDVAHVENIDLGHKLEVAQREIGLELTSFLLRKGASLGPNHELWNVIVTEPLAHWHAVHTIALVYRDAFNNQMNDRYRGKWVEFSNLADRARRLVMDIGVGMAGAPIAKAPAPKLSEVSGGVLPATTYYVRICWQRGDVAGAQSDTAMITVNPGRLPKVTIPAAPSGIAGAVVYAGTREAALTRQVDAAVAAGSSWTLPPSGLRTDIADVRTQGPDYYVANRREFLRG